MSEDIEKMVDEFLDEQPTGEWERPTDLDIEVWTVVGYDGEGEDVGELEAVIDALETTRNEPWYERLSRELDK